MIAERKVAAFFDIDGTLLAAPSLEWRFVSWLLAIDALSGQQIVQWMTAVSSSLLSGDFSSLRTNKMYLAGLPESLVSNWEKSLVIDSLSAFPQAAQRIAFHLENRHRVFLISGTLSPLARILARRISSLVDIRASNLEAIGGIWSGSLEGNHMSGAEKARAVCEIADQFCISLDESYAYGNELQDVPMLESVGNRVAINPTRRLKRLAVRRGWTITHWQSPQPGSSAAEPSLLSHEEAR
jgi:HAD superfamily hydrolase (TIGR01490 family)